MKKIVLQVFAVAVLGLAAWWALSVDREESQAVDALLPADAASAVDATPSRHKEGPTLKRRDVDVASAAAEGADVEDEPPKTEEESKEEAEEAAVEAFDTLTDKWMEPSEKGVTMSDVATFVQKFAKVPKNRQEECLQRALNLVPDENVMLLAGVLMDKSQPKELVELVYNDVLNRDEDVKKPILHQIIKDKTHPCWADTAWILDVTGDKAEKP